MLIRNGTDIAKTSVIHHTIDCLEMLTHYKYVDYLYINTLTFTLGKSGTLNFETPRTLRLFSFTVFAH